MMLSDFSHPVRWIVHWILTFSYSCLMTLSMHNMCSDQSKYRTKISSIKICRSIVVMEVTYVLHRQQSPRTYPWQVKYNRCHRKIWLKKLNAEFIMSRSNWLPLIEIHICLNWLLNLAKTENVGLKNNASFRLKWSWNPKWDLIFFYSSFWSTTIIASHEIPLYIIQLDSMPTYNSQGLK